MYIVIVMLVKTGQLVALLVKSLLVVADCCHGHFCTYNDRWYFVSAHRYTHSCIHTSAHAENKRKDKKREDNFLKWLEMQFQSDGDLFSTGFLDSFSLLLLVCLLCYYYYWKQLCTREMPGWRPTHSCSHIHLHKDILGNLYFFCSVNLWT